MTVETWLTLGAPPARRGIVLSLYLMGPLAGSAAMSLLGPRGPFLLCGGAAVLLAILGLSRVLVRKAPSAAQSEPFVALPRTTIAVTRLDPRVPEQQANPAPPGAAPSDGTSGRVEEIR